MGGSRSVSRSAIASAPELAVFLDDDERSGATLGQRTGVHADAVGREALDDRAVT